MIRSRDDESLSAETLAHQGVRRRPRYGIETQAPRCPICRRELLLLLGRRGPQWRCGCGEQPK
ncbi:MAG: hypothetical protein JNM56_39165 [Planctomycetia bacterium]|nr:hypothetical protein [Planctomycetia bacterium]